MLRTACDSYGHRRRGTPCGHHAPRRHPFPRSRAHADRNPAPPPPPLLLRDARRPPTKINVAIDAETDDDDDMEDMFVDTSMGKEWGGRRAAGACPSRRGSATGSARAARRLLDRQKRAVKLPHHFQTWPRRWRQMARRLDAPSTPSTRPQDYHAATTSAAASRGPNHRSDAGTMGRAFDEGSVPPQRVAEELRLLHRRRQHARVREHGVVVRQA